MWRHACEYQPSHKTQRGCVSLGAEGVRDGLHRPERPGGGQSWHEGGDEEEGVGGLWRVKGLWNLRVLPLAGEVSTVSRAEGTGREGHKRSGTFFHSALHLPILSFISLFILLFSSHSQFCVLIHFLTQFSRVLFHPLFIHPSTHPFISSFTRHHLLSHSFIHSHVT